MAGHTRSTPTIVPKTTRKTSTTAFNVRMSGRLLVICGFACLRPTPVEQLSSTDRSPGKRFDLTGIVSFTRPFGSREPTLLFPTPQRLVREAQRLRQRQKPDLFDRAREG